jgi:HEAT repeat protein
MATRLVFSAAARAAEPAAWTNLLNALPNPSGKYVGPEAEEANALFDELLAEAPASVIGLVDLTTEWGPGNDFRPRYALHGIVTRVGREGMESSQAMVAKALASTLDNQRTNRTQSIVLRELQFLSHPAAIPAIAGKLLDEELNSNAVLALSSIGGTEAADALRAALPKSSGEPRRQIVKGLGALHDMQATALIQPLLADQDRETRLTAAAALAEIGEPSAAAPLLQAAASPDAMEHGLMAAACIRLAERLIEQGNVSDAERLLLGLWDRNPGPDGLHVRCAALPALALTRAAGARAVVAEACRGDDARLTTVAVRAAASVPGEERTWYDALVDAPEATRTVFLKELGRRDGPAVHDVLVAAVGDASPAVQRAALLSIDKRWPGDTATLLLPLFEHEDGGVRQAAALACRRIARGDANALLGAALPGASTTAKREILNILAARLSYDQRAAVVAYADDPDEGVATGALRALASVGSRADVPLLLATVREPKSGGRRAAAADALVALGRRLPDREQAVNQVIEAANSGDPENRATFIGVLGKIALPACLAAVKEAINSTDGTVQDAAVRALANWPDDSVLDELVELARTSDNQVHAVLAMRGYVRLIEQFRSRHTPEDLLSRYRTGMDAAKRPEEQKLVMGSVAGMGADTNALAFAERWLDDDAIGHEAEASYVTIAEHLAGQRQADAREIGTNALARIQRSTQDEALRERIATKLEEVAKRK